MFSLATGNFLEVSCTIIEDGLSFQASCRHSGPKNTREKPGVSAHEWATQFAHYFLAYLGGHNTLGVSLSSILTHANMGERECKYTVCKILFCTAYIQFQAETKENKLLLGLPFKLSRPLLAVGTSV